MAPPRPWLHAPPTHLPDDWQNRCQRAFDSQSHLSPPPKVPVWVFLQWLADEHGLLLHGSQRSDISLFEPRTPNDKSLDTFSKQTAVFASSDAIWAMFYALTLDYPGRNMLNAALQDRVDGDWERMRYFFSLSHGPAFPFGDGTVYLLPREDFVQVEPYDWPGVGGGWEPQWASLKVVRPIAPLAVTPDDFPLLESVRRHDNDAVQARAQADPWTFPWLTADR